MRKSDEAVHVLLRVSCMRKSDEAVHVLLRVSCVHKSDEARCYFLGHKMSLHVLLRVSCVHKSDEACCYFLGHKMSLPKVLKDFEKTMYGKSCVLCKEDGPRTCLLSSNCAALFIL